MKRVFGVVMVSTCLGLSACGGQQGTEPEAELLHFSDVACPQRSPNALNSEAANTIIKNSEELEAAWVNLGYDEFSEMPSVDFSNGPLVMVYGGQRGTSNEWVVVKAIEQLSDNELLVKYDSFTANHPGCGGDGAISYPFCIVQADVGGAEVTFESNELNACEATRPDLE